MDCYNFVGGNFRADTRQVVVIDTAECIVGINMLYMCSILVTVRDVPNGEMS